MTASKRSTADKAWRLLVAQVMETREEWRRTVAAATGLPFSRVRVLKRLLAKPLTSSQLAEVADMDAPATSVSVGDLEARGLVERKPHPADKRAKLVSLTAAGKRVVAEARKITDRAPESLLALSEKDLSDLLRVLERIK